MRTIDYFGVRKKLSKIIMGEYPDIGYSYLQKLLRNSDIKVDGKRTSNDIFVNPNSIINIYINEKFLEASLPQILYEDENIVAFYKPKKMLSQGEFSFESFVNKIFKKDYILCHRLDTNTDGILLFAKSPIIFDEIKKSFSNGCIEKHYIAEVYGELRGKGEYKDYLIKNPETGVVTVCKTKEKGAKEIITEYQYISSTRDNCSLIDVKLVTGRTHQIRAHLAFHGFPILGDGKYGKENINKKYGEKSQKLTANKLIFHIKEGKLSYLDNLIIEFKKSI